MTEQAGQVATAGQPDQESARAYLRAGRYAWATVGILAVLVAIGWISSRLTLVIVPLVLALFPAALLSPLGAWLKRKGLPPAATALVLVFGTLLVLAGIVAGLVPVVAAELPQLAESLEAGLGDLEEYLENGPLGLGAGGLEGLLTQAQDQLAQNGELAGTALEAATAAVEVGAGFVFLLVALFLYLKDGERIAQGLRNCFPKAVRDDASEMGDRAWYTLGHFFRGQLFIALVDALFIGIGLLLLGVPLALPLSVLVFFGGLFPIVGAFLSGGVAVLVALADTGLGTALAVLALIIIVQQTEGNILEPLVLGKVIELHPLMVIASITAGAVTLGVLGAFLAVPVVASIARAVDYIRERDSDAGAAAGGRDEAAADEGEPDGPVGAREMTPGASG